jgi:hypothetical protein
VKFFSLCIPFFSREVVFRLQRGKPLVDIIINDKEPMIKIDVPYYPLRTGLYTVEYLRFNV